MLLVHHAGRASLARRTAALAAAAVLGAIGAGCGGSGSEEDRPAIGGARLGVEVRLVNCGDWRKSSARERLETVRALRAFATGRTGSPGGHGRGLDDEDAYRLFESSCRPEFARSFKLYKLYTRASAFGGPRS